MLGKDASEQIHKILTQRMEAFATSNQVAKQIRRARKYQATLDSKLLVPTINSDIKRAIHQYQACISAWADGADLKNFRHSNLADEIDNFPVYAEDLATILQEDEVGCQTGALRESGDSIILWHSEEDYEDTPGQRFDKLRLFSFKSAGENSAYGFIYPDLLPGPTFGWQSGNFIQAIDTLHVKNEEFSAALLPNTIAWLSLYLGTLVTRQELVSQLGPFQGGYSITAALKIDGRVSIEKIEFANSQVAAHSLENESGSFFFQTNIIADLSQPIGVEEDTTAESRLWNEKRIMRTSRLIKVIQKSADAFPLVFRLLRSRLGGDSAYSNQDVKAHLLCRMTPKNTSILVGAGPAGHGAELLRFEE